MGANNKFKLLHTVRSILLNVMHTISNAVFRALSREPRFAYRRPGDISTSPRPDRMHNVSRLRMRARRDRSRAARRPGTRRDTWNVGSRVEVYSNCHHAWFSGVVNSLHSDDDGEWLIVHYNESTDTYHKKKVLRNDKEDIREPTCLLRT